MRAVRCLIVDDDPGFRHTLNMMLRHVGLVHVVAEAETMGQAMAALEAHDPDLIFLDMELGHERGLDLIDRDAGTPMVIVVSASEAYAIRAFELRALDYLVKPFGLERLKESLSRLRLCCVGGARSPRCRAMSAFLRADDLALIDDGPEHRLLPVQSILFMVAQGNYTEVHADDGTHHLVRRSCEEWMSMLPVEMFVQADRRHIINLHQVTAWQNEGRDLRLTLGSGKREIVVGRAAAERVKSRMIQGAPV